MSRILAVDDERQITRLLRASLQASGYDVSVAADGEEALVKLASDKPDLLITDLAMPVMDGLELTKRVRQGSQIPIIVLSVRATETMKVRALDEGADDYVTKPFSMPELLARIRSQLRRNTMVSESEDHRVEAGDFVLDVEAHTATVQGTSVALTPKEYELLLFLARHPERVLTHKVILRQIWGHASDHGIENLRVLIAGLRKKLERNGKLRYIENEPWIGYRFLPGGMPFSPEK